MERSEKRQAHAEVGGKIEQAQDGIGQGAGDQVCQVDGGTPPAYDHFISYGAVAVFGADIEAAQDGGEYQEQGYAEKKSVVQRKDLAALFHVEISYNGLIDTQEDHKYYFRQKGMAFFQPHEICCQQSTHVCHLRSD